MLRPRQDVHMFELARLLFPDLRDSFYTDELPLPFIIASGSSRTSAAESARPAMSAAARNRESNRMKTYWAARRKVTRK